MTEDEPKPDSGDDETPESSDPQQQESDPDPRQEGSDTPGGETETQPETGTGFGEEETGQSEEPDESSSRRDDTERPREPTGSSLGREELGTQQGQGQKARGSPAETRDRGTQQPATSTQRSGTGRSASARGEPDTRPPGGGTRQGRGQGPPQRAQTGGVTEAVSERIRQFHTVIIWPESLIAGIGTWFVGFLLTALPLWWLDFGEETGESILNITVWVYIESVGGTINGETLAVTAGTSSIDGFAYGTLESNAFGLGPALHGFVPALVLVIAGYILAGRHINAGTTGRPLQSVLAGGSLAVWFTLTLFLAAVVSSGDTISVNLLETLIVTLLYAGVFASVGATVRSRTGLTSAWGLLVGIGTFVVGLLAWRSIDNPFEERPGVDGITDLEGVLEYTRLLSGFISEHGLGADEILPTWFVAVVPLLFGAVLAYVYKRRDPVVGFGEGARLGTTYALIVFVAVLANIGAQAQEYEQQGETWSEAEIEFVNQLIASAPRGILFAGVVYPVVFATIGGALGATAYNLRQSSGQKRREQTGQSKREPAAAGSATGGYRGEQGQQAGGQSQQSTGPGQQTPGRADQRRPEGADSGYRAGGGSPGQADNEYRSDQRRTGERDSGYGAGGGSPGQTDDQYRPEQGRTEGTDDGSRSDSGQADRGEDGSIGDPGRGEDRETASDASGEELSPGDIVGDDLDEDDTGDS